MMQEGNVFLTVDQAAQHLGVSRRTVERMVREGRLRWHRLGARKRFKREDLEASITPVEGVAGRWEWQRRKGALVIGEDPNLMKVWGEEGAAS